MSVTAIAGSALAGADSCPADFDDSGVVDGADLTVLLLQWGVCAGCSADVTGDGVVSGADLTTLLVSWGTVCPPWYEVLEVAPDPAVVVDAAARAAINATGLPWRVRDAGTQIEMLLIPPGSFDMGCSGSVQFPSCVTDQDPVHSVVLTQPFYLGRYEVTQAQWSAVTGSNPSQFQSASAVVPASQVSKRPVENVDFVMVQLFLQQTGLRLPTEAEWEYAYRAGTTTAYHGFPGHLFGTNEDSLVPAIAWFSSDYGGDSAGQTRPVGGKAANGFGLHDMAGNVWEWVNDWYLGTYYASGPSKDPQGPVNGNDKVLRGSAWSDAPPQLGASYRWHLSPGAAGSMIGFRVARRPS